MSIDKQGYHNYEKEKLNSPDNSILNSIKRCLANDTKHDFSEIEVTVKDGNVKLSGQVAGNDDKQRAEDLAKDEIGVKSVENFLQVKDSGIAYAISAIATEMSKMANNAENNKDASPQ
jgi:osmotically-inducible protein OsmY